MCSLVLDEQVPAAYLAAMGNAIDQLMSGRPVARLAVEDGRLRAYPIDSFRVTCHLGTGDLHYLTTDRWIGVHIDGDANPRRVDEVPAELCTITPVDLAPAVAA